MNPDISAITTLFFSPAVLMLAATIALVLHFLGKLAPALAAKAWYNRALPVLPEILGIACTFGHSYAVPTTFNSPIMAHLVVGLWIGMLSSKSYKIIMQTLVGDDSAIKPNKPE